MQGKGYVLCITHPRPSLFKVYSIGNNFAWREERFDFVNHKLLHIHCYTSNTSLSFVESFSYIYAIIREG